MPDNIIKIDSLIIILLAISGWLFSNAGSLKKNLHILQLEDYEAGRMLRIIFRQPRRMQLLGVELAAVPIVLIVIYLRRYLGFEFDPEWLNIADIYSARVLDFNWAPAWLIWGSGCFWRGWRTNKKIQSGKKPLVLTARAKRIQWVGFGLSIITVSLLIIVLTVVRYLNISYREYASELYSLSVSWAGVFWISVFVVMYIVERASLLFLAVSTAILKPFEFLIQKRYLDEAKSILTQIDPTVIGITGSYGKTGTKEILSAMLAEKYNVFRPPGSYNTVMGITRVVRERMRPYHEVFVAEMGAYRIGSIERLCNFVKPKHGIITTIGVQHLERFKSRENIKKAKGELVRALSSDGIAVLNGDDQACREIGAQFSGRVVYFSIEGTKSGNETLLISNISIGLYGSDFDITYPDGEKDSVHLSLLGRSAVSNAAAAVAMADSVGVPRKAIKRALEALPHTKHRLEPLLWEGEITVLDDAYNSNPIGARNALEVLSVATSGRRILVTPGMIELGELEDQANHEFGKQAAKACDLVVLVGIKRIEAIKKGLLDGGFDSSKIWAVSNLNDGLEKLKSYLKSGDTILLENDLPDQYDGT